VSFFGFRFWDFGFGPDPDGASVDRRIRRGQLRGGYLPDLDAVVPISGVRNESDHGRAERDVLAPGGVGGRGPLRPLVQTVGLLVGAPVVFLTGWTRDVEVLVVAMAGFGFFKGLYDANIWASLYDVVPARRRATAQGLMNAVGWLGAGVAPVAVAAASEKFGMAACLSATSAVYLLCGGLLLAGIAMFFSRPPARDLLPELMEDSR